LVDALGSERRQPVKPRCEIRQGDECATPCLSRTQVALADLLVEKSAPYPGSAGSLFDAYCERRRVGTHIDAPASVSMPESIG
jgi:hypothetical protein